MENQNFYRLGLLTLMLLVVSCANQTEKNNRQNTDGVQSSMVDGRQTIFENEYATVVKVSLLPGDSLETHRAEQRVIYSLSDYSIDWKERGENVGTKTWKKGEAYFHDDGEHAARNNGTTTAEWLVFTKKNAQLPDCDKNTIENDVNSVSPEYADVLFDNDEFKITEVTLPKGAEIPMHSGINRIIYSLTDYKIAYESDREGVTEKQFRSDEVHWHEPCMHRLEKISDTEAKYIVVSFKK